MLFALNPLKKENTLPNHFKCKLASLASQHMWENLEFCRDFFFLQVFKCFSFYVVAVHLHLSATVEPVYKTYSFGFTKPKGSLVTLPLTQRSSVPHDMVTVKSFPSVSIHPTQLNL